MRINGDQKGVLVIGTAVAVVFSLAVPVGNGYNFLFSQYLGHIDWGRYMIPFVMVGLVTGVFLVLNRDEPKEPEK